MCECGCGNFSGDLTFPGPDGDLYVLDVYFGCEDCDAPAGVMLYRFTPEEAKRWDVADRAEPLAVPEDGVGIPVMDADILKRLLVKEAGDLAGCEGIPPGGLFAEVIEDGLRNHFRDASAKTYDEWRKQRRKAKRRVIPGGGRP